MPGWEEHGARMAIGRDWASWEQASELLPPAPDADVADDAMLVLDAKPFPRWFTPSKLIGEHPWLKRYCLHSRHPEPCTSIAYAETSFLELTYRSYLFHVGIGPLSQGYQPDYLPECDCSDQAHLPVAAPPVGWPIDHPRHCLRSHNWYHASPSGYSRGGGCTLRAATSHEMVTMKRRRCAV